ncbi:hypothetical protein Pcinc_006822 [Petrolisthes cinctipes]|uniref:Uncharacterized protein n=1 Tax=Petrolisthes cinctipes TaxID=88211 RepID=A0AAE1GCA7_PETCI|nr:hypothetical protein Pcinc_006822 [Petrolisthes cinctipes]
MWGRNFGGCDPWICDTWSCPRNVSLQLEHGAGIHAARNQHHHLTTQISPSKMKGSPADHLDNKFTSATSPNSYVTNSTQE